MRRLSAALGILLLAALSCTAQNESLLIGPGDMVHVLVFDTPEMEQHVRVVDGGNVSLMFIGPMKIAGMTPAEAGHAIEQALIEKHYMLHPQVTVTVDQFATQNVSVMGQVVNPGSYQTSTPLSLIKVLSLAGGFTDSADRNITIRRQSDPTHVVNYFLANDSKKALSDDVLVYPGDTVLVPKAALIYVLGDVQKPGGYPASSNDSKITVLQAIALAGSANKTAVYSKVRLIRKTDEGQQQEIPLDLAALQKGKEPDLLMRPNDIIFVPFSYMKNMVVSGTAIVSSATSALIYK